MLKTRDFGTEQLLRGHSNLWVRCTNVSYDFSVGGSGAVQPLLQAPVDWGHHARAHWRQGLGLLPRPHGQLISGLLTGLILLTCWCTMALCHWQYILEFKHMAGEASGHYLSCLCLSYFSCEAASKLLLNISLLWRTNCHWDLHLHLCLLFSNSCKALRHRTEEAKLTNSFHFYWYNVAEPARDNERLDQAQRERHSLRNHANNSNFMPRLPAGQNVRQKIQQVDLLTDVNKKLSKN